MIIPYNSAIPHTAPPAAASARGKLQRFIEHPIVQSFAKVALVALAAIIALACSSAFAIPLATAACGMLTTQLAVKLLSYYHIEVVQRVQLTALKFQRKFPYLQVIVAIIAIVLAPVCPPASGVIAGILSIYAGIIAEPVHYRCAVATQTDNP